MTMILLCLQIKHNNNFSLEDQMKVCFNKTKLKKPLILAIYHLTLKVHVQLLWKTLHNKRVNGHGHFFQEDLEGETGKWSNQRKT